MKRIQFWATMIVTLLMSACASPTQPSGTAGASLNQSAVLETTQLGLQVCPDGPTTFGIDVSRWQSTIDWGPVARDGVKYAIIRVVNGTNTYDQEFVANWTNAREAGILRGAYQYFRPGQDPIEQADHFLSALRAQGDIGELPPVIDVEETDDQPPSVVRAGVRAWIDHVQTELNVRPMIYTGRYFWGPSVCGGDLAVCAPFAEYPHWHAQYGTNPIDPPQHVEGRTCPNISDTWPRWDFWQYGSRGRIDGIGGGQSDVDMNVFNGSYEDLLAFAAENGGGNWTPPPVWEGRPRGQTFPLAAEEPIQLCVGERMSGEMYIDNEGNQPWGEEVILAPTPRDQPSELFSPSWRSATRVTSALSRVEPGERGVFAFEIEPQQEGLINQTFNLLAEQVAEGSDLWFSDSGGPHDGYLELKVAGQACPAELEGSVELLSCDGVEGWAWDRAVPNRFVRVELSVQIEGAEALVQSTIAERPSLDAQCEGERCRHHFFVTWPEGVNPSSLQTSEITVTAYGVSGETLMLMSQNTQLDCAPQAGMEAGLEAGIEAGVEGGAEVGGASGIEAGSRAGTSAPMGAEEVAGTEAGAVAGEEGAGGYSMGGDPAEAGVSTGLGGMSEEVSRTTDSGGCVQSQGQYAISLLLMLIPALWRRRRAGV